MMRRLCLAFIVTTTLSVAAFAQSATPARTVQFTTVPADAVLSHSLIGLKVYNAVYKTSDEKVGEIKDLVIAKDMLDGYILSVGGFLGMGKHFVAVTPDFRSLMIRPKRNGWR